MNRKLLWKIESLWQQFFISAISKKIEYNFSQLYDEQGVSKYNPDFKQVSELDFSASEKPAHHDEYGEYYGLQSSQVLEKNGKRIYVIDNHNKILQVFLEYHHITGQIFDVVHIDAHADDAVFPQEKPHHLEIQKITEYIRQTRISDFFDFISDSAIFSEIHRYITSSDFQGFVETKKPYILSLDIDIFGPEGDFVDVESKIKIIAESWQSADVICIAMSPGFIDQKYASDIISLLTK